MVRPQRLLQLVQAHFQNVHVVPGRHRERAVVVADAEGAVPELQLELLVLQDTTILIPEHRQQDLVLQLGLDRLPLDVEEARVRRRLAVLQHVRPPGIAAPGDAHVVRHDVHDLAHAMPLEGLDRRALEPVGRRRDAGEGLRVPLESLKDLVRGHIAYRPPVAAAGALRTMTSSGALAVPV